MNIVIATEVINVGGAETFALRMAAALQKQGHNVLIFAFYKDYYEDGIYKSLAPDVKVVWAGLPKGSLCRNTDRVLFRLNIDYSLCNNAITASLRKTLLAHKTDIIHSNLLKVDKVCLDAATPLGIPVITTIHGDYLQFYSKQQQHIPIPLRNYNKKAHTNLGALKQIACISDKQVAFFDDKFQEETAGKISKIYNGYSTPKPVLPKLSLREKSGIKASDFVFGMVSRGLAEKGWEEAIKALIQINNPAAHLVFIGGSKYLDELAEKYINNKQVHFIGFSSEPLEWINIFDAGLLPSTYASESLPTVVIEYLRCNKPVIASDAGEIRNMVVMDGKEAGIIIPVKDKKVPVDELAKAMNKYITDRNLYSRHKQNTEACFDQFDMDKCVTAYTNLYKKAIAENN